MARAVFASLKKVGILQAQLCPRGVNNLRRRNWVLLLPLALGAILWPLCRGLTPEGILEELLGDLGLTVNDTIPTAFSCSCSKERVEKAIISIGSKEIREMIRDGKPIEVKCHFCNEAYSFQIEELKKILEKAKR